MDLVIDGRSMAVTWPSGVPVMDLSLVLGDTVPVRIRVDHALTDCTPALAVKQTIGSADLIMTVTGWTREGDWQTADWVINTVPLQTALGSADRVDLVAELVLVAPDGAQHTSRPIKVWVRRDMLPAEFAPPAEVLADWSELVASALAAQLPDALTAAGMHVDPVTGSSTLSTGPADTWTPVSLYALTWGDELLAGNLTDSCRLRQVTMTALRASTSTASHWLRVLLGKDGNYTQIGISSPVTAPVAGQSVTWDFAPGLSLNRGDKIMLEICAGADAGNAARIALDLHVVNTPVKDGRGICTSDGYPAVVTDGTMAPMMTVMVDYDDGVMVGGVELTTVTQMQGLGNDVRTAAVNSQAAAQSATAARDQAQAIADNMTISAGSVTTGAPGTQAAITLTPGATPGSWVMSATIPRGDVGAPGADADLAVTDARYGQLAGSNSWHGIQIYYNYVTMMQGLEVQGDLYCTGNITGTFTGTFDGEVTGYITPQSRLDFAATRGGQIRYYLTCVSGGQMMSLFATGGSSPTLVLSADRGGMSIPGTLTTAGAINANGGINIPLAVTPATDTAAVNRIYSLGLAQVAMEHHVRNYWVTGQCTGTNGVTINHVAPCCYLEASVPGNTRSSLTLPVTGCNGRGNYSNLAGISMPIHTSDANKWIKMTVLIGAGWNWVEHLDADVDSYRIVPVPGDDPGIARIIEVTTWPARTDGAYRTRVREIIGAVNEAVYIVRTTESLMQYDYNTAPPCAMHRIVIAQRNHTWGSRAINAGVWMIIGGLASETIIKLADISGWDPINFECVNPIRLDLQSNNAAYVCAESPTMLRFINGKCCMPEALDALSKSWITTTTEEPFIDPDQATTNQ